MAKADEKNRKDQWIPVDEAASTSDDWSRETSTPSPPKPSTKGWEPPPPSSSSASRSPEPKKTAPVPVQQPVSPEERAVWADPVLSPWAKEERRNLPSQPATSSAFLGPTSTNCPRCSTRITYARNGSPPWEATCPNCNAKGRFWK